MVDADIDIARDEMAKSLIDMCSFEVTLPLSDKTKNIHTNSFIYFEPVPQMEAMENIYENMGRNKSTRYVFFRKGYWYVKDVKISYSDSKQEMKLTLSPFPTVFEKQDMSGSSSSGKTATKVKTKKEKNTDPSFTPPDFLSKSDKLWATDTVRKAIGTKKDKLAIAKAVYSYFYNHYSYQGYKDLRYTTPKGNREKAFKRGSGNCADGANIIETLMLTAGINAKIKHAPNHYIVKMVIDGKTYWCDNAGRQYTWNKVYHGVTSENTGNIESNGRYILG